METTEDLSLLLVLTLTSSSFLMRGFILRNMVTMRMLIGNMSRALSTATMICCQVSSKDPVEATGQDVRFCSFNIFHYNYLLGKIKKHEACCYRKIINDKAVMWSDA